MSILIPNLKKYVLFGCPKCHNLTYARTDRKTTLCRKCGYRIKIDFAKIQPLYTTDSTKQIIETIKKAKILKTKGKLWKK